ncbi:hypothetical protein BGW36DRAFT_297889 [Talaromyces proteolyticus]|uniref:PH domain protein n=1 Tax=Talaromyces proteolyticus TaxID=1131652 RepID=A0AAD4KSN3_9EURO|nr:uncharacterized protein BGW36DRAFT_297889 [Talaromyces proteolyticus]KAH8696165.1 hypothetical protein BGW36DRAFT_297889 [Talaromyces proteolyticus]
MATQLASLVGRRILKENVKNKFGQEDPYFEVVPASRLGRAFGKKTQRRRKAIPPGLSPQDAKILNRVKRRAYQLDYSLFNLCGIRFGWGSVIGIIPFAGDGMDAALAMMVARECQKVEGGLPSRIYYQMMINIAIDFFIGLVPFIGDLADAIYKCNTRNAVLLEKFLREKSIKAEKLRAKREHRAPQSERLVDLSIPEEFDRYEDGALPDPPGYTENPVLEPIPQGGTDDSRGPTRPEHTPTVGPSRKESRRSGGRKKKQKQRDLEAGVVDDRR